MTGSSADIQNNARLPPIGVRHPLRIGKSLRRNRRSLSSQPPRDMMAIKFTHVPEGVVLDQPGTLERNSQKCSVQLPMDNGSSIQLEGGGRTQSAFDDYVLVFYRDTFWLEKTSDMFFGVRPVDMGKQRAPIEYPNVIEDEDMNADPDSWIVPSTNDPESGSPITPEEDVVEDTPQPPIQPSRVGGKSTPSGPNAPNRRMVSGGRVPASTPVNHKPTATKSVAGKGLASKRPTRIPEGNFDNDDDGDNDDDSSSSDDSDDDSDSGSGSDSENYTDESSDEE